LNNAGDMKHEHAAGKEGSTAGDTNTLPDKKDPLLEKDGRERCRPVETAQVKNERPAGEERERERDALGGKMKKKLPLPTRF